MNEILANALHAIDRLNSWVRSDSFRRQSYEGGSLRRVIYHMKRQAILRAHAELACEHGPFMLRLQCRDCGGSGRYLDCNGYRQEHCWACGNSGTVTLHFVETRIGSLVEGPLGDQYSHLFTWHSPADKFPHSLPLESEGRAGRNWSPNLPGRDMTIDEACAALNVAHEFFRDSIPDHHSCDRYDCYVTEDSRYALWIGEDHPSCAHCGVDVDPDSGLRCGRKAGRVGFTFFVCKLCRERLPTEQQYCFPVPKHLWGRGYGKPNVNEWIVRQNAFQEKPKQRGWAVA